MYKSFPCCTSLITGSPTSHTCLPCIAINYTGRASTSISVAM